MRPVSGFPLLAERPLGAPNPAVPDDERGSRPMGVAAGGGAVWVSVG
jgi:hypothetical protein